MTEFSPTDNQNDLHFEGKHVTIQLADDETLTRQLESNLNTQLYIDIRSEDRLPYPARSIRLESWRDSESNVIRIEAEVVFRPTSLQSGPNGWPGTFLQALSENIESSNYEPSYQTHDPGALYLSLDPTRCVRLSTESTATECAIDICIELTGEVEDATAEPLGEPYSDYDLTPLEQLRHITALLGITTDQLRETYGNPPRHPKHYLLEQRRNTKELAVIPPLEGLPHSTEIEGVAMTHRGLDLIGGATTAKRRLRELADIIDDPEAASLYGIKGNHFLLHGPPGTGKSSLVEAFTQEIGATLWPISSADIVEKWVGESGRNLVDTFDRARAASGRIVVFFDEFDALARKGSAGTSERIDVRKILNTQIENIAKYYPNIVIAAATNADMDDLEPSLIRSGRFEAIGVPLPNEEERFDVFGTILLKSMTELRGDQPLVFDEGGFEITDAQFSVYNSDIDISELARISDGMSGADFEEILNRARKKCFLHYRATGEMTAVDHAAIVYEILHFGR